jgi:hypothetical protein
MMKFKANTVYVATQRSIGKRVEILAVDDLGSEIVLTLEKGKIKEGNIRDFKSYKQSRPIQEKEKKFIKAFYA